MKQTFTHTLDFVTAKKTVDLAFESYSERLAKYNPTLAWQAPDRARVSFDVLGTTVRCTITVLPGLIELEAAVPAVFLVFKDKARAVVEKEIAKWFRIAVRGDEDQLDTTIKK